MNKIIIAGGSGYLGSGLVNYFRDQASDIVILSRQPKETDSHVRTVVWNASSFGEWTSELENADVIINLTGKSVDCRYSEQNKKQILNSRLDSTAIIGKAIQQCKTPPRIWINASSATIYKASFDKFMTESKGDIGDDFSMTVCKKWEEVFNQFQLPQTRKVILRTSIVLGNRGGALVALKNLVKVGFGGIQGDGKQFVSWIHEYDFCRIVDWIIQNQTTTGAYNATAPNPVTNFDFMSALRRIMKMPVGLPLPKWLLTFGANLIGTETELVLKSRKVISERLLESTFQFEFPTVELALNDLLLR